MLKFNMITAPHDIFTICTVFVGLHDQQSILHDGHGNFGVDEFHYIYVMVIFTFMMMCFVQYSFDIFVVAMCIFSFRFNSSQCVYSMQSIPQPVFSPERDSVSSDPCLRDG